jgi:hypothetical protein
MNANLHLTWTARGVRATPEQAAELAKKQPLEGLRPAELLPVAEDGGSLSYADGEQGRVGFTRPFLNMPNVEVLNVIVTDITRQGFQWKCPASKAAIGFMHTTSWKARGVLDPTAGKGGGKK